MDFRGVTKEGNKDGDNESWLGPVGLLACSIASVGAKVKEKIEILQEDEVPMDIINTPRRNLKELQKEEKPNKLS